MEINLITIIPSIFVIYLLVGIVLTIGLIRVERKSSVYRTNKKIGCKKRILVLCLILPFFAILVFLGVKSLKVFS